MTHSCLRHNKIKTSLLQASRLRLKKRNLDEGENINTLAFTGSIDAGSSGRCRCSGDELWSDARSDELGQFQLADAFEDVQPGVAQVVAVGVGHRDESFDRVNILALYFRNGRIGREQRKAGQSLDEGVPF